MNTVELDEYEQETIEINETARATVSIDKNGHGQSKSMRSVAMTSYGVSPYSDNWRERSNSRPILRIRNGVPV